MKFEDFAELKQIHGVKISMEGSPAFDITRNFSIVVPGNTTKPVYIGYGTKSAVHAEQFAQSIGLIKTDKGDEVLYELDIIDYEECGSKKRGIGAIIYDAQHYAYAAKDLSNGVIIPLSQIEIIECLGNLFDHKALVGCDIALIYKLLNKTPKTLETPRLGKTDSLKQENKTDEKAAVDIYVDVHKSSDGKVHWGYKLAFCGKEKIDKDDFKICTIDHKEYYMITGSIIALQAIKKSAPINIYTTMPEFADIVNNHRISTWANTPWINRATSQSIDNMKILKMFKNEIDRLGGDVTAYVVNSLSLAI